MRFELYHRAETSAFLEIYDDAGKHIGNTTLEYFVYDNKKQLKQHAKTLHKCIKKALLGAIKKAPEKGCIAYLGLIELDYRERGKGYGTQVLTETPALCIKYLQQQPDVVCAYILPNSARVDLEHYQNQPISQIEYLKMCRIMMKTFHKAGFAYTGNPHVMVKEVHA